MGLDIIAANFPKDAREPTDIPKGWEPLVFGTRELLKNQIEAEIPIVKFASSQSGLIIGDDFALVIDLGEEEDCKYINFAAKGNDKAVGAALHVLNLLDIRGIECSESQFLELYPGIEEGFRLWHEYLTRAASRKTEKEK
jgi:hypothetical protein